MEGEDEGARLEAKTREEDSLAQLQRIGLRPGQRVLDAGAGTGAVARTMARLVGAEGRVVALDTSKRRLAQGRRLADEAGLPHLAFVEGDVYDAPLPEGAFDVVWCRFLFEYLAEPQRALESLVRWTRPGGTLAVADLDGNGLFHDPMPEELAHGLPRLQQALRGRFDPNAGRHLFRHFVRAGLKDIQVHAAPYHLVAGSADAFTRQHWALKLERLRRHGSEALGAVGYQRFVEAFLRHLASPESLTYSVLFLVCARKP
jgi:ubiquinone/menaquinone biosynthesis C-methylase UbiE